MCDSSKQTSNDTNLSYWQSRWQENRIGFHRSAVNELVKKHLLEKLNAAEQQQCVVFPLCGKSLDMMGVVDAGHRVIGIEGSQMAIEAFFTENQIQYEKEENNQWLVYKGVDRPVTIYCGDFFQFNQPLPKIDYIWDRGGLVAVSLSTREQYRDLLYRMMIPDHTRLFLVAMNYNDPNFTGPPHKLTDDEVNGLFGSDCSVELLDTYDETADFNSRTVARRIDFMEEHLHSIIRRAK